MARKASWDYEQSTHICATAWGILQSVVPLNVANALAIPIGVLRNLVKYFDRR